MYCCKKFNMKQVYKVKSESLHLLPKIFWWGQGEYFYSERLAFEEREIHGDGRYRSHSTNSSI